MPKHQESSKRRLLPDLQGQESEGKKAVPSIVASALIDGDTEYVDKLRTAWEKGEHYQDDKVTLDGYPFLHGECKGFIQNEDFLTGLFDKMDLFEWHEKASDLFQFRQSDDLKAYIDPHIKQIMEYLKGKVLDWLRRVTQLPLNGNVDLFLSDYRKNDFLLCHDDELDSRRIAFILYLSPVWKEEFGGNLDLFSATQDIYPKEVVKSIVPEFNKFAFFSVGAKSFHQVSEVLEEGVKRMALSGWYYGDPAPRPIIEFPRDEGYSLSICTSKGIMKRLCSDAYLQEDTQQDINEQITEESQVLIPGFLLPEVYKGICADIVENDVSNSVFRTVGPANVANFKEAYKGPPTCLNVNMQDGTSTNDLIRLFHSDEFLSFLEKLTELPFTTSNNLKATSSLKKITKGCYSLLRSGGAKQTGELDKTGSLPAMGDKKDESEEDIEEDPNLVDVTLYFASKWDEAWGGLTIYSTTDGEQLITIPPEGNCLAVVVRNSTVNSYVNYTNCNAGEEVFFAYTVTFGLDGNF